MVKPKSEMERYQAMMRELMRSRERRESKRNIGRLSVAEVRAELAFNPFTGVAFFTLRAKNGKTIW